MDNGYWNAHSDRDWEDQLHEPPVEDDEGLSPEDERLAEGLLNTTDNDPQPRSLLDPSFDIFDVLRWATHTAYPEARIPEIAMPDPWLIDDEPEPETELDAVYAELASVKQELKDADGTIELLRMRLKTAAEWAGAYEAAHGPFKDKPSIPDFMVVF